MAFAFTEIHGSTAWFTLNRPDQMNAYNKEILTALDAFVDSIRDDQNVRCLVITGTGNAFCAGADLKANQLDTDLEPGDPDFTDLVTSAFGKLRAFPKPAIAALNGYTMAGGLEMAMCCDLIIAANSAKIGDCHGNFGVFPGAGGAGVLPQVLPLNVAKYLLFTGKVLSASEMKTYGLVNEVVADNDLHEAAQSLADLIAAKSPLSLERMKAVASGSKEGVIKAALNHEQVLFRQHMRSADIAEGLDAFAQKRKPQFVGR